MGVTIRISSRSLRNRKLPFMLLAALLPLPMAMLAAVPSGYETAATPPVSSVSLVSPGSPDNVPSSTVALRPTSPPQATATRKALARTASGDSLEDLDLLHQPWFGDLDGMIAREAIRVLVPMSKTSYFLDGAEPRGISYEAAQMFEKQLNESLGRNHLKVHVVMIPVGRDELISGLVAGYGDVAMGNITITPERLELVDFSDPLLGNVSEVVVTGSNSPTLNSLDDLSGNEVYVRPSSSYYAHLEALNERFAAAGRAEMTLTPAPEVLEDEDLLEMINAGILPIIVVDSHMADFWEQIFTEIVVHDDIAVATDQNIGWAFRKNSPQLETAVNAFAVEHKKGTLLGNVVFNKYLKDTSWAKQALADEDGDRFRNVVDMFRTYGEQYDLPWLLIAAQGYQESGLDQSVRSAAGAVGIMQLLPSTAADPNVDIDNIEIAENNIHAGTKYLRFLHDRYFADDPDMTELDRALFSFAAYNAGPSRVARLRSKADEMGLDSNKWFRNVEVVAAQEIGRETVQYVSNIYKYFIAYERVWLMELSRDQIRRDEPATR